MRNVCLTIESVHTGSGPSVWIPAEACLDHPVSRFGISAWDFAAFLFPALPSPQSPFLFHPHFCGAPNRAAAQDEEEKTFYQKEMERYRARACGSDTNHERPLVK
mmetsp:Transcript_8709/g.21018  ORF Transcript_8709/g.21018 Transcript_8709/m.21018 type:complete len:105 (-) Transcript_8709:202-516(-)